MKELDHRCKLLSKDGGVLDYVSPEGEILASVQVPAGLHRAKPYFDAAPEGVIVQVGCGLVAVPPRSAVGVVPYGDGSHDTGANPDWRPMSNADQLARQMRLAVDRMNRNSDRLERKMRAQAALERIPAPAATPVADGEGEVVE